MNKYLVTVHTIAKNEDRFIWYALKSVLPYVEKVLVFDTGSTDKTVQIIKELARKYKNLEFRKCPVSDPDEYGKLREKQVNLTKTPWFLVLDGDEIWPEKELIRLLQLTKELPKEKIAVVNRTRNCVGDIWHYLPESFGKYRFLNRTGHYTIRLMRKLSYSVENAYPKETYAINGESISSSGDLVFSDSWYLHVTHLCRSSVNNNSPLFTNRRQVIAKGIAISKKALPSVIFDDKPALVENVTYKRSALFEISAYLLDFLRDIKRKII
jgi:glycosyltransferase involved in cell wall biosynthesis